MWHNTLVKQNTWRKHKIKITSIIVFVVFVGISALWLNARSSNPGKADLSSVKQQVGRLMLLPTDEEPTLATVIDKSQISDPFLKSKAKNGDDVLVYSKNQLVIIFRPSIKKIAAIGTLAVDPALSEAKASTLTVLDGGNNPGKEQKIIADIKTTYPEIKITDGGIANRHDFPYTIVIDNTNQKDNLVDALDKVTGGRRGVIPISEQKAATDLMVIVGLQ